MSRRIGWALLLVALLGGCRGTEGEAPPFHPIRNMYQQPRYNPQAHSDFFADGRTMRPLVPGTVAQEMEPDLRLATGLERTAPARYVAEVPAEIARRFGGREKMVQRGRDRFDIYCAPCHGILGDGKGLVAQRAEKVGAPTLVPPSFHQDRLRRVPDGYIYAVVTNGVRNMPAYRHSIPLDDRWAIVSYVRALQLAELARQHASLDVDRLTAEEQR